MPCNCFPLDTRESEITYKSFYRHFQTPDDTKAHSGPTWPDSTVLPSWNKWGDTPQHGHGNRWHNLEDASFHCVCGCLSPPALPAPQWITALTTKQQMQQLWPALTSVILPSQIVKALIHASQPNAAHKQKGIVSLYVYTLSSTAGTE